MKSHLTLLTYGFLGLILIGCGEGNDLATGIDGTGSGGHAQIASVGTADKQENIIKVNGVNFNIDGAKVIIDNEESDSSNLVDGQVVTINGTIADNGENGTAEEIIFNSLLQGKITQIDQATKTITVLEQIIVLHDDILFGEDINQFSDLTIDNWVTINGFRLSDDSISATRIDRIEESEYKITGLVSKLDDGNKVFYINDLKIDFNNIQDIHLENESKVSAQGIQLDNQGTLIADIVNKQASITDSTQSKIELEGFITQFTDFSNFSIGETSISTNLQTVFVDDQCRLRLELDIKIEVEGALNNNVLEAEKIICLVAGLTSHKNLDAIGSSSETFSWNNVNADEYRLDIYASGEWFYRNTFNGNTTSITIDHLPETNATYKLFLSTKHDDFWSWKSYTLYGTGAINGAKITSHSDLDVLSDTSQVFTWTKVNNSEAYRLVIRDSLGKQTYHDQTYSNTTHSVAISNLPNNAADMIIEMWTLHQGWWSKNEFRITSVALVNNAILTSHSNNQTLSGTEEIFTWEDVGAEEYSLSLRFQGYDSIETIYDETFSGNITSATVTGLPLNSTELTFYLQTRHNGWSSKVYTFTGASLLPDAELTSHKENDRIVSNVEEFTWAEIPEAEEYRLKIEKASPRVNNDIQHFHEDYNSYITSQTISGLPVNGAYIFLTLSTKHSGFWANKRYLLKGAEILDNAVIKNYKSKDIITNSVTTLAWEDVGASRYHLIVEDRDTEPRVVIHNQTYESNVISAVVNNIPQQSDNITVRLFTEHEGWWAEEGITLKSVLIDK